MVKESTTSRQSGKAWWIGAAVGVVLLCIALLPQFLSTRVGCSILGRTITRGVRWQSASFRWGHGQELTGLRWVGEGAVLTVDQVSSTLSLWSLLWGGRDIGEVALDHPTLSIIAHFPQSSRTAAQENRSEQPLLPFHLPVYGSATTSNGELSVTGLRGERTTLSNLSLTAAVPSSRDALSLELQSDAVSVQLQADQNLTIQVDANALPVASLEGIASLVGNFPPNLWTSLLGETLTLTFNLDPTHTSLSATSPLMTASFNAAIREEVVTLTQPGVITGFITPEAFERLTGLNDSFTLTAPVQYKVAAQELVVPAMHWREATGRVELITSSVILSHLTTSSIQGSAQRAHLDDPLDFTLSLPFIDAGRAGQATLSGALHPPDSQIRLDVAQLPTRWLEPLFADPSFVPLLGSRLNGWLVVKGSKENALVTLALDSNTLHLNPIEMTVTPDRLDLNSYATITLAPPDHALQMSFPYLIHVDPVEIQLKALSIARPFDWAHSTVEGELSCPFATLSGFSTQDLLDVEKIHISMSGETLTQSQISIQSTLSLLRLSPTWREWIGDRMTLSLYGLAYESNRTLSFDLLAHSAGLSFNATPTLTSQGILQIVDPIEILATPPLLGGADFRIELSPLSVNLLSPSLHQLDLRLSAELQKPHNGLNRLTVDGTWRGPTNVATLAFDGLTERASPFSGSMNLSGFLSGDELRWELASCNGEVDLTDFPTAALAGLSEERRQQLNALFGRELTLCSSWSFSQLSGPLALHLLSQRSRIDLDGALEAGALTLAHPFKAQVAITPYLGSWLLGKINPLLSTAISGDRPLSLDIAPTNFRLPLLPYAPAKITVPSAAIDCGKLLLANRGGVESLIRLAQPSLQGQPAVHAWFTPLPISVVRGEMYLSRMDALIGNSLHIATWGKIDLVSRQVRMMLALTPDTISQLAGAEEADYFLIPISGEIGSTSIDWPLAATQLATLLAKRSGGTTATVGKVVELITGVKKAREKVPPQPSLPWP